MNWLGYEGRGVKVEVAARSDISVSYSVTLGAGGDVHIDAWASKYLFNFIVSYQFYLRLDVA